MWKSLVHILPSLGRGEVEELSSPNGLPNAHRKKLTFALFSPNCSLKNK